MKRYRWFYLFAVLGILAWSSGLVLAAEPSNVSPRVPDYEKKVNWNVAVFLIDYDDIPAEHREKWPTALEWERMIFHDDDDGDMYNLQEWLKTISNGEFIVSGDVFDYTTSTATYWDSSGILLDSQEVVDAVDFQVPGFDPDNYDLFIINSGHDAALGQAGTNTFKVTINGNTIEQWTIVSFFQIGVPYRSTDYSFTNTLVKPNSYLIPQDDGSTLENPVVYNMSGFMETLVHEFGHALGVQAHANSSTNGRRFDYEKEVPFNPDKDDSYYLNFEYGNSYEIMGGKTKYAASLNGQFRNVAGLLPQEDIATFSQPGTFTTRLYPINSTESTRFAEVLLPFKESPEPYKNNGYGLEVRDVNWMDTIFDEQADVNLAGNLDGVFVIKTQGLLNRLLDMSPSPNIKMDWGKYLYDIRDVVLKPGMVYENDEVRFYDVVNHGDGSFSVTVDIKSDKAWTPAPDQLTATTLSPSGDVRLDWVNHHVGAGSTGKIQILTRTTGTDGWQASPFTTADNDATSFVIPVVPGELWEYTIYVQEDANYFRSLDSNIASFACNLKVESLIERNISCSGETDGEVEILVSGGTPPYQYGLAEGSLQASNILTGLSPGTHSVQVTDSNQCQVSATTSPIVEPRAIAIELKPSGAQTEVLANYGSGLYEYSSDGFNWGTDSHLDLGPDDDTVYVSDQQGCIASRSTAPLDCSYTVSQPNGGEIWYQGETNLINWVGNGADCSPAVDLKLYKAGVPDQTIATQTSDTSFAWTIPTTQDTGTEFKIRVIDARAPDIFGQSADAFAISVPACNQNAVSGVTESAKALHEACETLIIGPSFIAEDGASIMLSSGLEIKFLPGFLINKGATLDANVCGQSLCETSSSPMPQGCHSCVVKICDIDPHCCDTEFDRACLEKIGSECGLLCK